MKLQGAGDQHKDMAFISNLKTALCSVRFWKKASALTGGGPAVD